MVSTEEKPAGHLLVDEDRWIKLVGSNAKVVTEDKRDQWCNEVQNVEWVA